MDKIIKVDDLNALEVTMQTCSPMYALVSYRAGYEQAIKDMKKAYNVLTIYEVDIGGQTEKPRQLVLRARDNKELEKLKEAWTTGMINFTPIVAYPFEPKGKRISLDLAKRVIAKFEGYLDDDMIARIQIAIEKESEAEK